MRGQPTAATNCAAASRLARSRRKVASSLRNSTGKPATAGMSLSCVSSDRVASRPSFIAPEVDRSTPGNPTRAASLANSGHGTRPATSVLFSERYTGLIIPCFLDARPLGAAERLHSGQLRVGGRELRQVRHDFRHRARDVLNVLFLVQQ